MDSLERFPLSLGAKSETAWLKWKRTFAQVRQPHRDAATCLWALPCHPCRLQSGATSQSHLSTCPRPGERPHTQQAGSKSTKMVSGNRNTHTRKCANRNSQENFHSFILSLIYSTHPDKYSGPVLGLGDIDMKYIFVWISFKKYP